MFNVLFLFHILAGMSALTMAMTTEGPPATDPPFFMDPVLDWPRAFEDWGAAWPLHVYLSAFAYIALSIWALIHFIRVGGIYVYIENVEMKHCHFW